MPPPRVTAFPNCSPFPTEDAAALDACFDVILDGFTDYTIDQRGDVGSFVRLASINAIERCFAQFGRGASAETTAFDQARLDTTISLLLKQILERFDRMREAAGATLQRMVALAGTGASEQPFIRGANLLDFLS